MRVHAFGPPDGPPLVALHGSGGHGLRWRSFAAAQLPRFRVYAPDLRGVADPTGDPPWTLERHARDVLDLLDSQGLRRTVLIGHSFGAVVAVYAARHAPDRITALILLDPAASLPAAVAARMARGALEVPAFDGPADAARELYRTWPPAAHELVDEEIHTRLARDPDGRWRWRRHIPALVAAYTELTRPAVTPPAGVPTLLIRAERSPAVDQSYVDACRAALATLLALSSVDCGHDVVLECPTQAGRLVRDFLATITK